MKKPKIKSIGYGFYCILMIIISVLGFILYNLGNWVLDTWGLLSIDEIIFHLKVPLDGTNSDVVLDGINACVPLAVLVLFLSIFLIIGLRNKHGKCMIALFLVAVIACGSAGRAAYEVYDELDVKEYLVSQKKESHFIEQNYVDPRTTKITFPEQKRNLIYIYLESMESTFASKEDGGGLDFNCIPELTKLAEENTNFSNTDQLGGALPFTDTTWTIASMTSQFTGLPLKVEVANDMDQQNRFMPGAKTIGDILNENGYIQELMIGSQKEFAGTDKLFLQHGFDKICDINSLKQEYSFKSNELNQWGLDDYKLFELAKNEITQLAQTGKFNFTMATIDCHMPKGFLCKYCPDTYENRYENIYACQSKLINSFIDWCKSQSWYENTTIVLVGDHPTMAQQYVNDVPSDYQRTTYNCFINSKIETTQIKNRQFTHMDMYPTTLAAMGFNIEGNKLALGTNLFSELPTIIEKYGQDYINEEVQKSSEYLDKNIYQFN